MLIGIYSYIRADKEISKPIMGRAALLPIGISVISLLLLFLIAYNLQVTRNSLMVSEKFTLVNFWFRDNYWFVAGSIVFGSALAAIHSMSANRWNTLYLTQLTAGILLTITLVFEFFLSLSIPPRNVNEGKIFPYDDELEVFELIFARSPQKETSQKEENIHPEKPSSP
jgi:hypothetical protein